MSPFMPMIIAEHLHHTVKYTGLLSVVMDLAASSNQIQASVVYSFNSYIYEWVCGLEPF